MTPARCQRCSRFLRGDWPGDECPEGVGCHGPNPFPERNRCKQCRRWIPESLELCPDGTGCRGPFRHALPPGAGEAAREARLGKADPHRPKVSGGRRRLAEPVPADAPWWEHRAYFLRTDPKHRWSYQRIADELGKPYRQVYKALNRERVRQTDVAYGQRNRQELSRRELERRRALAPSCEKCGQPMSDQYVESRFCAKCRAAKGRSDQLAVLELYKAGWTLREIDQHLGRPRNSANAILSDLRAKGIEIPYRRPPQPRSDEQAA